MYNSDIGLDCRHRRQAISRERTIHFFQVGISFKQIAAQGREGRHKRNAHCPGTKGQGQGQIGVILYFE